MSGIFISYRREDSIAHAGRLYDRLSTHFGRDGVFMDIDTIDLGVDFVDALMQTVASCDVLIAVIGKQWLNARDEEGRRRLDNPEDFVRVEISAALERGVRVIPVLVGGSRMPQSADLPDQLAKLARRNALDIPDMHFGEVVGRLITSLERIITEARQQRSVEQERVRAEAERQRFVEVQRTEAERQRLAEPGKAQAGADEQRVAEGEKVRTETERQPAAGSIGMQERPLLDSATVPASDEERRIAAIVAILFEYQTRGFYVTPGIPLALLASARRSCAVPESEPIVGVLDCSGIGTASQAIAFGTRRFYYATGAERGSLEYLELPANEEAIKISGGTLSFSLDGSSGIRIGLRGSSTSAGSMRKLLVRLSRSFRDASMAKVAEAGL
jgi:hypothetical protein